MHRPDSRHVSVAVAQQALCSDEERLGVQGWWEVLAFLPDIRKQSRARTAVERRGRNVSRGIIAAQGWLPGRPAGCLVRTV
jgi:hypothetical protein